MKAKHLLFLLSIALSLPLTAQEDDMYFVPSKKQKNEQETVRNTETAIASSATTPVAATGSSRDVDEYNRRGKQQQIVLTDTLGMQWALQTDENGQSIWVPLENEQAAQDSDVAAQSYEYDDDFSYTQRLGRFHSVYTPYYSWYDPWFDPWYDPWYTSPWYRSSWYYGPHYGWGYGWNYGWGWGYGPGWYGPGFYPHYYYPVYVPSGGRGSSFGHSRGGAMAAGSRGSGVSNSRSNYSSRNTGVRTSRSSGRVGTSSRNAGSRNSNVNRSTTSSSRNYQSASPSRSSSRSSGATFSSGSRGGGGFSGGGSRGGGGFSGGSRGGGGRGR